MRKTCAWPGGPNITAVRAVRPFDEWQARSCGLGLDDSADPRDALDFVHQPLAEERSGDLHRVPRGEASWERLHRQSRIADCSSLS